MLRTIASRNEWIFRRTVTSATRSAARVLSSQAARNLSLIRWASQIITNRENCCNTTNQDRKVNAIANFMQFFKVIKCCVTQCQLFVMAKNIEKTLWFVTLVSMEK